MSEILENIEDDLQIKIDAFLDKLTIQFNKEARHLKEVDLRNVCVDYAQVDAKVVQDIYKRLIQSAFQDLSPYIDKWQKSLLDLSPRHP